MVSNRLPIVVKEDPQTGVRIVSGSGGLVTALAPVLEKRGGTWIGWLGRSDNSGLRDALGEAGERVGYELEPVALTEEEVHGFYEGFANEVLWPLFHDFIPHCNFDPEYWPIYEAVNHKYAEATRSASTPEDYVWIHDYHLMLVARELRAMGVDRDLGFFLHIPFPPLDVYIRMPWRQQIIEALLEFDLIGFQTPRDLRNFLQCVRHLMPEVDVPDDVTSTAERATLGVEGRRVQLGAFPISIDYDDFLSRTVEDSVSEVTARVRMQMPRRKLILGLDRLDYTKGIPDRIRALDLALERYPELRGEVTLLQIVVPSRTGVSKYQNLKKEIDQLVGEVNGKYSEAGWAPIQYIFRRLTPTELLAYYRASDVALVTPLKDGMNLVAKEYCACSLENDGVLILSEFAGAAFEMEGDALLVNPYDTDETAEAIHRAVVMDAAERSARMQRLRQRIRHHDIYRWVASFLTASEEASPRTLRLNSAV